MLWTVDGGVYGVCELNCSKSCRTAEVGLVQQLLKIRQIRRAVATTFTSSQINVYYFLPRDSYAKRGICRRRVSVSVCVCVCVCVCVSVTLRYCITSGSAMAEGPRDALVSRNSATTKYPHHMALFA